MNLKLGIVGLPNVGKSTLFNALTKSAQADAQNFPFCTIDPNVGLVEVPDKRVDALAKLVNPAKIQRSVVEFVDIAGLVEGASTGEGLGNKFLANIRECNAICHVVRDFSGSDVHHVAGNVDPSSDFSTILTELILADLESVNRQIERVSKKTKSGDKIAIAELDLLNQVKVLLEDGKLAKELEDLTEDEVAVFKSFHLLTAKKFMIVANTAEDEFANFDAAEFRVKLSIPESVPVVPVCAKIEAELVDLDEEEAAMFLEELGAKNSGIENLIAGAFDLLGLQSYFTAGVTEVRAWTIYKGDTAPKAAGAIHGDFERGFIKADVIAFDDYVTCGGEAGAKEAGKMKMQGKDYLVQDGDVMHFKFNV